MPSKQSGTTPHTLTPRALNRAALARQMLLRRERAGVVEAVERLAGLQAQYSPSPYIGLWTRVEGFQHDDLTEALHNREVVKASLMRWTLHIVSARDYPYMNRVVTEGRTASWRNIAEKAGVDTAHLHSRLLQFASQPRLMDDMLEFLNSHLPHDPKREPRILWYSVSSRGHLVHTPPSGTWKYFGKNSYIAAHQWLGPVEEVSLQDALAHQVRRYLAAFGPATRNDAVQWAGLRKMSHVDQGLKELGDEVVTFKDEDGKTLYDLADSPRPGEDVPAPVRFLPKWDNLLLAYDNRTRVLPKRYHKTVIKVNGDVIPTFLVDGVVAGAWSVKSERDTATLLIDPFEEIDPASRAALEEEGERLIRFVEPEAGSYGVSFTQTND